uniref:Alpha-carbonic anhydrase domain-containing protein n=1 Tax=Astyanax mexicanus TaxID=7994 RepID=A0A8B9K298_ASTMX
IKSFFGYSVHPMWQEPLAIPGGERQSPIDISVRKSMFDPQLKPLVMKYDPRTCQQIWNNGYSFLVEYDDTTDKSIHSNLLSLEEQVMR